LIARDQPRSPFDFVSAQIHTFENSESPIFNIGHLYSKLFNTSIVGTSLVIDCQEQGQIALLFSRCGSLDSWVLIYLLFEFDTLLDFFTLLICIPPLDPHKLLHLVSTTVEAGLAESLFNNSPAGRGVLNSGQSPKLTTARLPVCSLDCLLIRTSSSYYRETLTCCFFFL
jgi:hypothetical protein